MEEIWKPIPSWPGYSASSLGRIRCEYKKRSRFPEVLRCKPNTSGYTTARRMVSGKLIASGYHTLICEAFHGPAPIGKPLARHLDDSPSNNIPSNLAWGDAGDNAEDARRNGKLCIGVKHGCSKITDDDVVAMFHQRIAGETGLQIGERYGINRNHVNSIIARRVWKHVSIPDDIVAASHAVNAMRRFRNG